MSGSSNVGMHVDHGTQEDAAKLADPDFHEAAAEAMAEAIVEFRARMDALRERSR